ncbi:MAG: DUF2975 domain-containing protein [Bacteroidales bacterium]
MRRLLTVFFQAIIALIGGFVLVFLLWVPSVEGRATNLDLVSTYFDPFVLFIYTASIPFFFVLFYVFKFVGYIGQNTSSSSETVDTLKRMKNCSIVQTILITISVIYIALFHHKDDDPAGFITICVVMTIFFMVLAFVASRLVKKFDDAHLN